MFLLIDMHSQKALGTGIDKVIITGGIQGCFFYNVNELR